MAITKRAVEIQQQKTLVVSQINGALETLDSYRYKHIPASVVDGSLQTAQEFKRLVEQCPPPPGTKKSLEALRSQLQATLSKISELEKFN